MRLRSVFRAILWLSLFVPAALLLAQAAAPKSPTPSAADHHDRSPQDIFRLKPLSGGVSALYGRGGNVGFFVGPDAIVVIDSQFKDIARGSWERSRRSATSRSSS